ncbi:MAG TPA: hypothetical protein VNM92_11225 [Thermoanaerobaculia bacterium]|nr:hypothetical protein [Thermoanaerobaculia bacterium]
MYAQKKNIANSHIIRERDRERFRELLAVLSIGVPVGLFLLLFTWQNLEVIRLGRDITRLQKSRKTFQDNNKALQLQIERLTALNAVETKAASLGLRPAESNQIVLVSLPRNERAALQPRTR